MKMQTKLLTLILFIFSSPLLAMVMTDSAHSSSDSSHQKLNELGLRVSGGLFYSVIYKRRQKENVYWRFRSLRTSFDNSKRDQGSRSRFIELGIAGGMEKRIQIKKQLYLIQGGDLGFSYTYTLSEPAKSLSIHYACFLDYVAGLQLHLKAPIYLNLELSPGLYLLFIKDRRDDNITKIKRINVNFATTQIVFTIGYCF